MTTVQGVTMSTWVPVITAGSFDAFVIGALITAACFIAIVISWRSFKHEDREQNEAIAPTSLDILRDDPAVFGPVAGPFRQDEVAAQGPVEAFSLDRPQDEVAVRGPGVPAFRPDRPQDEAVRGAMTTSPHWYQEEAAVGGPVAEDEDTWPSEQVTAAPAGSAPDERVPGRPASEAWTTSLPEPGPWLTGPVEPASGRRQSRVGSHRAPHSLGDPIMAEGMPKPPGARRPPRHAAPSPRLGAKKAGVSATHSLPDSSRS
jgi:hypothetical protein